MREAASRTARRDINAEILLWVSFFFFFWCWFLYLSVFGPGTEPLSLPVPLTVISHLHWRQPVRQCTMFVSLNYINIKCVLIFHNANCLMALKLCWKSHQPFPTTAQQRVCFWLECIHSEELKTERYHSRSLKPPGEIQRLWSMAGHCWPGRNKPLTQNPINCYKFFTISRHISQQCHTACPAAPTLERKDTHTFCEKEHSKCSFQQTEWNNISPPKLNSSKILKCSVKWITPTLTGLQLRFPAVFISLCFYAVLVMWSSTGTA